MPSYFRVLDQHTLGESGYRIENPGAHEFRDPQMFRTGGLGSREKLFERRCA